MTKWKRLLPFTTLFAVITLGVLMSRSWLNFFSVLAGFALVAISWAIWVPLDLHMKTRTRRPQLEQFLDEMIKLVEQPARPLEKIVIYNASCKNNNGEIKYTLQVNGDAQNYFLNTTITTLGRHAGRINVHAIRYAGEAYNLDIRYPDFASFVRQEPWLMGRLVRLRALVGNVSWYETMQKFLKKHESAFGEDANTDPLAKV